MKKPDTKAASVLFGVELETVIPAGCGVQVGNYHRGIQVTGGLRKSDGTVVTAPKFNRMPWRAEHDGSIRGSGVACEFVSPILHAGAGGGYFSLSEELRTFEAGGLPVEERMSRRVGRRMLAAGPTRCPVILPSRMSEAIWARVSVGWEIVVSGQ